MILTLTLSFTLPIKRQNQPFVESLEEEQPLGLASAPPKDVFKDQNASLGVKVEAWIEASYS